MRCQSLQRYERHFFFVRTLTNPIDFFSSHRQLLTIISSNMASINDNVGRVSSRIGADSEYTDRDDNERQLNTLKSTYQRMRAILILCGSLSAMMGFMMLFFAIFRREILHDTVASEAFALIWIHGAR